MDKPSHDLDVDTRLQVAAREVCNALLSQGKVEAVRQLGLNLFSEPQNVAWGDLAAEMFFRCKDFERAELYARHVKLALPGEPGARFNWARSLFQVQKVDEAVTEVRDLITCHPSHPHHRGWKMELAVFLGVLGELAEAEALWRELLAESPADKRLQFNYGWHEIHRGQFREGMRHLSEGRSVGIWGNKHDVPPFALGLPAQPEGAVLLRLEGGLGDEIIGLRFVEHLRRKGFPVVLLTHPSLREIAGRLPGVIAVASRPEDLPLAARQRIQSWMPAMDVPSLLNLDESELWTGPYLQPAEKAVSKWRLMMRGSRGPRVGVRWSGNPQFEHEQFRTFDVTEFLKLLTSANHFGGSQVQLFSFQRDHDLEPLDGHRDQIRDLSPFLTSWDDTLAALSQLDLLITSCTSVAHAASALGVPTWVIVPTLSYYVWAKPGPHSPWYSENTRIFRQARGRDWSPCWKELSRAWTDWLKEKSAGLATSV